jgi:hypothetical protein
MTTRVLALVAIGLWLVTVAVAVVLFVRGQTAPSTDGRQAILLAPAERDLVLAEMRTMLGAVQGVLAGANARDMKNVAAAARTSGMAAAADIEPTLMAKLPLEFKNLGISVHKSFDELAAAADAGASGEQALAHLSEVLNRCVACHAAYRLDAPAAGER